MYFDHQLCLFQLEINNQDELFEMMSNRLYEEGFVKDTYCMGICNREKEYPTGIMFEDTGFAIPHTDSKHVNKSQICFASLKNPIEFCDMTNKENKISVELVFMLAMSQPHEQVETLQNLMGLFQDLNAVKELKSCTTIEEFSKILSDGNVY